MTAETPTGDGRNTTADPVHSTLRPNAVGTAGIIFFVVAAASPLSAALGGAPAAIGLGNGAGAPGAYLIVGVVLLLFSVGYAAMSGSVTLGGGFATYIEAAFGSRMGRGAAYLATMAYVAMQAGLYGILGFFADAVIRGRLNIHVHWSVWAFGAMVVVGVLAYFEIDFSAKILGILMICEVVVLLVVTIAIVAHGGASGLSLDSFTPTVVTGGALGVALVFGFASFIGFEATAIYSEEARAPERTIPRATYVAVLLITVFLVVTVWSFVMGHGVGHVKSAAASNPNDFVFSLSGHYVGDAWTDLMQFLLITSFFAALLAFHNTIARYLFNLSRRGWGPAPLARTHPRHRSPHVAGVVQSFIGALIVVGFAAAGLDPYGALFAWMVGLGTLAVIVLQAWTSLAVVAYFRANPHDVGRWRALVAPTLGGIGLIAAVVLVLSNWSVLVGSSDGLPRYLPLAIPIVVVLGVCWRSSPERSGVDVAYRANPH